MQESLESMPPVAAAKSDRCNVKHHNARLALQSLHTLRAKPVSVKLSVKVSARNEKLPRVMANFLCKYRRFCYFSLAGKDSGLRVLPLEPY